MNYVYQDASRKLGMLKRVFSNCDTETKENLFNQLIRSKLEYACSAWDPHTIIEQRKLELIQKERTSIYIIRPVSQIILKKAQYLSFTSKANLK